MSNYKIIAVDKDLFHAAESLERDVNNFLWNNTGFFANTPPVVTDDQLIQMLVHVDMLNE